MVPAVTICRPWQSNSRGQVSTWKCLFLLSTSCSKLSSRFDTILIWSDIDRSQLRSRRQVVGPAQRRSATTMHISICLPLPASHLSWRVWRRRRLAFAEINLLATSPTAACSLAALPRHQHISPLILCSLVRVAAAVAGLCILTILTLSPLGIIDNVELQPRRLHASRIGPHDGAVW